MRPVWRGGRGGVAAEAVERTRSRCWVGQGLIALTSPLAGGCFVSSGRFHGEACMRQPRDAIDMGKAEFWGVDNKEESRR